MRTSRTAVAALMSAILCSSGVFASPGDSDDDEAPVVAARPAAVANGAKGAAKPAKGDKPAKGAKPAKGVAFEQVWLQPFFAGPLLHRAAGDYREEQWSAAETGFLKGAGKLPPKSDERNAARYLAALAKANQGKWSDAAALFQDLYRDYERLEPYLAYNAARCLLRAGQPQAALDWAAKVPNGSVPDAEADLVALDAQRGLSRWKQAAKAAADYLSRYPSGARRPEVMFKRADALEKLTGKSGGNTAAKGKATAPDAETEGQGQGQGDEGSERLGNAEASEIVALYRRVWAEAPLDDWSGRANDRLEALASAGGADAGALRTHDAASWFSRAMVYFDRNRNSESESAFANVLTAPGLDTELECKARYHRAQSVWKQRARARAAPLFDDAEPVCARAKNADLHAKSLYQGARSWANAGNRAAAEARYARLETEHADHSYADDARVRTAELAFDASEDAAAEKILAEVPDKYPKGDLLSEAMWRLAFSAWRAERYDDALHWLDESLRRIPREEIWYAEGRALYWKARVLEKLKDAQEKKNKKAARGYYERAIREYPLSVYALLSFARIGDKDPKARDALVRELRDKSKTPPFHFQPRPLFGEAGFRRAVDLARMGQGSDARRELNKLGLQTVGEKHGDDKRDEEDVLWIAAVLLDRAGLWNAAHSIPRYTVKDYALAYPRALGNAKWRISYPRAFPELVAKNSKANQIPEALQLAIMREESAFSPRIESFANAIGLTQMLQKTAKRFANGANPSREQLMDPAKNLEYGSRFLAFLWTHFAKAAPLTIAGYNAGEGAVDRWLSERGQLAMDEFMETIPYDETRNYTKRVLASFFAYSWLYDDKHPVPAVPLSARRK